MVLAYSSLTFGQGWQGRWEENRTDSSLFVQNRKCAREGFRVKRRIYFYFFRKIWSFRNRKMSKLFSIFRKSFWKPYQPRVVYTPHPLPSCFLRVCGFLIPWGFIDFKATSFEAYFQNSQSIPNMSRMRPKEFPIRDKICQSLLCSKLYVKKWVGKQRLISVKQKRKGSNLAIAPLTINQL